MKLLKAIIIVLFTNSLYAGTVSLDFDSLPSAQGWTYDANVGSVLETDAFSVSGAALHQDTIGVGTTLGTGTSLYTFSNAINPDIPFSISVTARVLENEGGGHGFIFGATTGTEIFTIGLRTDVITGLHNGGNVLSTTIDNTVFHDYRMDVIPGVGYDFFVDDTFIGFVLTKDFILPNELRLGDGTNFTNARADVTSFEFTQADAAVPEPSTYALFLVGIVCLFRERTIRSIITSNNAARS